MSSIILGIIFLAICCVGIALWYAGPYLLIGAGVGIFIDLIVHCVTMRRYETGIVETEIINIEPITKRGTQNTGYSVGYGYYEYYEYVDVKVGDKVTFRAKWKDGRETTITCKKGDSTFKCLYRKLNAYPQSTPKATDKSVTQMETLAKTLKAFENKRTSEEINRSEVPPEVMEILSAKTEEERIRLYKQYSNKSQHDK